MRATSMATLKKPEPRTNTREVSPRDKVKPPATGASSREPKTAAPVRGALNMTRYLRILLSGSLLSMAPGESAYAQREDMISGRELRILIRIELPIGSPPEEIESFLARYTDRFGWDTSEQNYFAVIETKDHVHQVVATLYVNENREFVWANITDTYRDGRVLICLIGLLSPLRTIGSIYRGNGQVFPIQGFRWKCASAPPP